KRSRRGCRRSLMPTDRTARKQAPECVRQVITLGSPVNMDPAGETNLPRILNVLYRLVAHPMGPARKLDLLAAPVSCLYRLSDGVVPPEQATVDGDASRRENIRVPACHFGMAVNPVVLWVVADRLAQPEGRWRPVAPSGVAGWIYDALTPDLLPI